MRHSGRRDSGHFAGMPTVIVNPGHGENEGPSTDLRSIFNDSQRSSL